MAAPAIGSIDVIANATSTADRRNYQGPSPARLASALPADARVIIERETRSVTQSAPARRRCWRLRFDRRLTHGVDPLTGWTTGADPLAHLSLRFPDLASAIRYAERHDLPYEVRDAAPAKSRPPLRPHPSNAPALRLGGWPGGADLPVHGRPEERAREAAA